ncbi:hypothetical protein BH10PSE14_BH10PSE14_06750 [soil metagenome]
MSTADIVNTWFAERVACGAIARDTEAYNQAVAALPDLIERLAEPASADAAAGGESTPTADPAPMRGKSKDPTPPADPDAPPA